MPTLIPDFVLQAHPITVRLEAPFAGHRPQEVLLFLRLIYSPEQAGAGNLRRVPQLLPGLLRLAGQLQAHSLLHTLLQLITGPKLLGHLAAHPGVRPALLHAAHQLGTSGGHGLQQALCVHVAQADPEELSMEELAAWTNTAQACQLEDAWQLGVFKLSRKWHAAGSVPPDEAEAVAALLDRQSMAALLTAVAQSDDLPAGIAMDIPEYNAASLVLSPVFCALGGVWQAELRPVHPVGAAAALYLTHVAGPQVAVKVRHVGARAECRSAPRLKKPQCWLLALCQGLSSSSPAVHGGGAVRVQHEVWNASGAVPKGMPEGTHVRACCCTSQQQAILCHAHLTCLPAAATPAPAPA